MTVKLEMVNNRTFHSYKSLKQKQSNQLPPSGRFRFHLQVNRDGRPRMCMCKDYLLVKVDYKDWRLIFAEPKSMQESKFWRCSFFLSDGMFNLYTVYKSCFR